MNLVEAMVASLVLMFGAAAAGQLWSHGLRVSRDLAQREAQLQRLDALLLASEGLARVQASRQAPAHDCQVAIAQLLPALRALPDAKDATLTQPPSPPATLHLRWETEGLRRERLYSATALRLCQEGTGGT